MVLQKKKNRFTGLNLASINTTKGGRYGLLTGHTLVGSQVAHLPHLPYLVIVLNISTFIFNSMNEVLLGSQNLIAKINGVYARMKMIGTWDFIVMCIYPTAYYL